MVLSSWGPGTRRTSPWPSCCQLSMCLWLTSCLCEPFHPGVAGNPFQGRGAPRAISAVASMGQAAPELLRTFVLSTLLRDDNRCCLLLYCTSWVGRRTIWWPVAASLTPEVLFPSLLQPMVAALFYNGLLLGDLSVPKIHKPLVPLPWQPLI